MNDNEIKTTMLQISAQVFDLVVDQISALEHELDFVKSQIAELQDELARNDSELSAAALAEKKAAADAE